MAQTWDQIDGPAGTLAVHSVRLAGRVPGARRARWSSSTISRSSRPVRTPPAGACPRWPTGSRRSRAGPCCAAACAGWGARAATSPWPDGSRTCATLVDVAERRRRARGVWMVGFGTTGALALCLAAGDERVRGVATLGSPSSFDDWAHDLPGMVAFARNAGVISSERVPRRTSRPGVPPSPTVRPGGGGAPPWATRPLLIVHGAEDEAVPVSDARLLAEAAGPCAELRILPGRRAPAAGRSPGRGPARRLARTPGPVTACHRPRRVSTGRNAPPPPPCRVRTPTPAARRRRGGAACWSLAVVLAFSPGDPPASPRLAHTRRHGDATDDADHGRRTTATAAPTDHDHHHHTPAGSALCGRQLDGHPRRPEPADPGARLGAGRSRAGSCAPSSARRSGTTRPASPRRVHPRVEQRARGLRDAARHVGGRRLPGARPRVPGLGQEPARARR